MNTYTDSMMCGYQANCVFIIMKLYIVLTRAISLRQSRLLNI